MRSHPKNTLTIDSPARWRHCNNVFSLRYVMMTCMRAPFAGYHVLDRRPILVVVALSYSPTINISFVLP